MVKISFFLIEGYAINSKITGQLSLVKGLMVLT